MPRRHRSMSMATSMRPQRGRSASGRSRTLMQWSLRRVRLQRRGLAWRLIQSGELIREQPEVPPGGEIALRRTTTQRKPLQAYHHRLRHQCAGANANTGEVNKATATRRAVKKSTERPLYRSRKTRQIDSAEHNLKSPSRGRCKAVPYLISQVALVANKSALHFREISRSSAPSLPWRPPVPLG